MIPVSRREHKLLIAIHGWSGVVLGLLLLVVVATGTVAVMGEEIGHWSAGTIETRSPMTRPLDDTVRKIIHSIPIASYSRLDISASTANRLMVVARRNPGPKESGIAFDVAEGGRVVNRYEGSVRDIYRSDPAGALSNFIVQLHVRLYVPEPWGDILTGITGLAMLVAAVSGLFIHRHLFADMFTLRRGGHKALANRDRHNVAGTWALPFAVVLAFTGSFLSFAGSVGIPALSWVSFGGDQQKLLKALDGQQPAVDATPTEVADVDGIVADATARGGVNPEFIQISNPGRADAQVTVDLETGEGDLTAATLVYDGTTGSFVEERPSIGRVPSAGATAFSLMGPLHFGNFAGIASKLAWVALGLATCFVSISGMRLWLARRIESSAGWIVLDRAVSVVTFGLPLSMSAAAIAFFATLSTGASVFWTAAGFVAGAGAAIVVGLIAPRPGLDRILRAWTGVALLTMPLLRLGTGGPGWFEAAEAGQGAIPFGDIAIAVIGAAYLAEPFRLWRQSGSEKARPAILVHEE